MSQPRPKTDKEIRDAIRHLQASLDDDEANGGEGGPDWRESMMALRWLKWTLGERR